VYIVSDSQDPSEGAQPMPGVELEGQQVYPTGLEKFVSIACVGASVLMIAPALAADLVLPGLIQAPLIICGLPIIGFSIARLLTHVIHFAATN
tara:strand:+ start:93 stop:371 length:279 start_codon:yes stop_codon:yes gene_type:complete